MKTAATLIDNYINSIHQENDVNRNNLLSFHAQITEHDFLRMLKANAENLFLQRGLNKEFIVDDDNKYIIRQLYYYLTADERCDWDVNRGVYLMGKVGCGKSVLMYSYLQIQDFLTRKITTNIHAKLLIDLIVKEGINRLAVKPLFIDELGRENLEMKDYGNVIKPVIDLFAIRYEKGGRTYATSNFTLDDLEASRDKLTGKIQQQRYGNFIRTRMDEMFNIVLLKGGNRREKMEK